MRNQKNVKKSSAKLLAINIVKNNKYTTICQGISKPELWKRTN